MSFVTIFRSAFLFLCILFSLVGYTIYQLNVSVEKKDAALRRQQELRFLGEQLAKGSDYLTASVRSYVQFRNKLDYDNFWQEVNKTRSRDIAVEKLKELKVLPEELKYIYIAKNYSDNLIKTEKAAMQEMEDGDFSAARKLVFGEYYLGQKKLIMENIKKFQDLVNKRAFERTREAQSNAALLIKITNMVLILSGILVLFFFYFIGIKQLVEPLKTLTNLMLNMAKGDFDERIPFISQKQNNEIHEMASTLDFFKVSLIKRFENERLLDVVVNSTTSIIYFKDTEGNYLFTNKHWNILFGKKNEKPLGKIDLDLFPKKFAEKFIKNDRKVIKSGIYFEGEECIPVDGRLHTYISTKVPLRESNGNIYGLCGISTDITEIKQAQEKINLSEKRFRTIFEESPLGVALIDSLTGHIYEVNLRFAEIAGRSLAEMASINWMSITHPDDVQKDLDNMAAMNAGKVDGFNMEKRYIKPDKTHIWVNLTVARVTVELESQPMHLAMIEDITKKKEVENVLQNYQNHLEYEINSRTLELKNSQDQLIHSEKLSTLGFFASTVAHEFNNPLFGIINLVDQLGGELNEAERKKFSKIAQKECWRMADMIKNLQSFYKPSEGVFTLSEVDKMIAGVLLIIAKSCEIKEIQINQIYNTDIFSFEVIEDQITQVILNVLQNSIDSISHYGGKITLTLDRTNSNLILKIQDTGVGIKAENLKLIFDPFFTTKGKEGTGLGLSVSYGIIKSHGGEIVIESELGVGSTVTLTLPIARKI
jgi:PAS domain S-box-containing protein